MGAARGSLLSAPRRRYHLPDDDVTAREQREARMASIDNFNDHCWRAAIPEAHPDLYSRWRREPFLGARPALLAIDLYDLDERDRPRPPHPLNPRFPNSS